VKDIGGIWDGSGLGFTGFGHYFPRQQVLTADTGRAGNDVDRAVIGAIDVRSRHVHAEDESVEAMAVRAAGEAVERAGIEAEDVDLLILSSWSQRIFVPELGPQVAHGLGARRALAFDVCGACTGFVHGTQLAAALLRTHTAWKNAVVVCSETFSSRVRPGSKGELIVGDAAGAVVLGKGVGAPGGLIDTLMLNDGGASDAVTVLPPRGWVKSKPHLVQLGIDSHVESCTRLLERNALTMRDVDWFVPHPGTGPMHEGIRRALEIPEAKFVTNFEVRANTGSAAIPTVLSEGTGEGRFRPGDLVLASAVGSGWFFGGLLVRL
jgi:3-oxoacyl-[acyl-carrier-protein] synthase III